MGFGPNRVRSLPDGVAQILDEYLRQRNEMQNATGMERKDVPDLHRSASSESPFEPIKGKIEQSFLKIGDLCPECGQAAFINEEGCRKCYACGYSEC